MLMWAKKHKFWMSVIILFVVGLVLGPSGIIGDMFAYGELLGYYTVFGLIIKVILWGIRRKHQKEGK